MRRFRMLVGFLVVVAAASSVSAAVALGNRETPYRDAVRVTATPFELRGEGDAAAIVPVHLFTGAAAVVPTLEVFAAPAPPPGTAPALTASNPTHEGFDLVLSVIDRTPDGAWLQVRLPMRPNGTTGWVRSADVQTWLVPNRIEVNVTTHRLTVFRGDSSEVLFDTDVATGRPQTPTPLGDFFIDIVNPLGHHPVYGWGQLSVAGFSDVLERFAGGIGQIAIHGWNDDSVMGRAASNGCVRMRNGDIATVASLAPLGTPVRIVA